MATQTQVERLEGADGGIYVSGQLVRRDKRKGEKAQEDGSLRPWESHTLHLNTGTQVVRIDCFGPPAEIADFELGDKVQVPVRVGVSPRGVAQFSYED